MCIYLESGKQVRLDFEILASVQNKCGYGWNVEVKMPEMSKKGDQETKWFCGMTRVCHTPVQTKNNLDMKESIGNSRNNSQIRNKVTDPQNDGTIGVSLDNSDLPIIVSLSDLRLGPFFLPSQNRTDDKDCSSANRKNRKKSSQAISSNEDQCLHLLHLIQKGWIVQVTISDGPKSNERSKTRSQRGKSPQRKKLSTLQKFGIVQKKSLVHRTLTIRLYTTSELQRYITGRELYSTHYHSNHRLDTGFAEVTVSPLKVSRWHPQEFNGLLQREIIREFISTNKILKARFTKALAELHRIGLISSTHAGVLNFEDELPKRVRRTTFETSSIGWSMVVQRSR